jgi:hypothetical protein
VAAFLLLLEAAGVSARLGVTDSSAVGDEGPATGGVAGVSGVLAEPHPDRPMVD